MGKEIYVVVASNDKEHKLPSGQVTFDDGGPLVFEQYTRSADLASIRKRAESLSEKYGECRIAKLEFIDNEGI